MYCSNSGTCLQLLLLLLIAVNCAWFQILQSYMLLYTLGVMKPGNEARVLGMRLQYLIWSNPMILQREPRIGTALSIYTESYFLPLFQGPSFWPEPALGGSHVPLLMSPVAWECPCVRTSVRNLLTPTSHPQPFSHTHPHSSQSHLHILHSYHLTAMLYPATNPPLSLPLHMVHSFTPHTLPPLIASPPHSLPHSQPLPSASPLTVPFFSLTSAHGTP